MNILKLKIYMYVSEASKRSYMKNGKETKINKIYIVMLLWYQFYDLKYI